MTLTVAECKEMIQNIQDAQQGQEWRLMVPLRELVLERAVPPVPFGGDLVDVCVCSNCLAIGREWIGLPGSFLTLVPWFSTFRAA